MTDPADLTDEMRFLFGVQKHDRIKPWKPLPDMQSGACHCFTTAIEGESRCANISWSAPACGWGYF